MTRKSRACVDLLDACGDGVTVGECKKLVAKPPRFADDPAPPRQPGLVVAFHEVAAVRDTASRQAVDEGPRRLEPGAAADLAGLRHDLLAITRDDEVDVAFQADDLYRRNRRSAAALAADLRRLLAGQVPVAAPENEAPTQVMVPVDPVTGATRLRAEITPHSPSAEMGRFEISKDDRLVAWAEAEDYGDLWMLETDEWRF